MSATCVILYGYVMENVYMSKVLAFSCYHAPYQSKKALNFLKKVSDWHQPDKIVCLGDLADVASVTYHEVNPDMDGAKRELDEARKALHALYNAFPNMIITMGNHDLRYARKAQSVGIPSSLLNIPNKIWDISSTWKFVEDYFIDKVRYLHGTGCSKAHLNAFSSGVSHCQGHLHSDFNVLYRATNYNRIFGATVGCLADHKQLAFAYSKPFRFKPVMGCGIIHNGHTCQLIPMET